MKILRLLSIQIFILALTLTTFASTNNDITVQRPDCTISIRKGANGKTSIYVLSKGGKPIAIESLHGNEANLCIGSLSNKEKKLIQFSETDIETVESENQPSVAF